MAERPGARAAAAPEYVAEELLGALAREEVRLVGRALVCIAGRHRNAVDAQRAGLVEKPRDALRIGIVEQRAIDVDPEAARLGGSYRRHGALVDAFFAHRAVMHLAIAIQMH